MELILEGLSTTITLILSLGLAASFRRPTSRACLSNLARGCVGLSSYSSVSLSLACLFMEVTHWLFFIHSFIVLVRWRVFSFSAPYSFVTGGTSLFVWHPLLSISKSFSFLIINTVIAWASKLGSRLISASKDAVSLHASSENGGSWNRMSLLFTYISLFNSPEYVCRSTHSLGCRISHRGFFTTVEEALSILFEGLLLYNIISLAWVNSKEFVYCSWRYRL